MRALVVLFCSSLQVLVGSASYPYKWSNGAVNLTCNLGDPDGQAIFCPLPVIHNGYVLNVSSSREEDLYLNGTVLYYGCDFGRLPGHISMTTCMNGKWTPMPSCTAQTCPLAEKTHFGAILDGNPSLQPLSHAKYFAPEWSLPTNPFRVCAMDEQGTSYRWWDYNFAFKVPICRSYPVQYGHFEREFYEDGENAVVICTVGFTVNTVPRCSKGTWSSYNSTCIETPVHKNACQNGRVVKLKPGYTCDCDPGYEMHSTGVLHTCKDIDECARLFDLCDPDAACVNRVGGYTCECPPGKEPYIGQSDVDSSFLIQNVSCIWKMCASEQLHLKRHWITVDRKPYYRHSEVLQLLSGTFASSGNGMYAEFAAICLLGEWSVDKDPNQGEQSTLNPLKPCSKNLSDPDLRYHAGTALPLSRMRVSCKDSKKVMIGSEEIVCGHGKNWLSKPICVTGKFTAKWSNEPPKCIIASDGSNPSGVVYDGNYLSGNSTVNCTYTDCANGRCVFREGVKQCECLQGFHNVDGQCVPDSCSHTFCGHGSCMEEDGIAKCQCDPGFSRSPFCEVENPNMCPTCEPDHKCILVIGRNAGVAQHECACAVDGVIGKCRWNPCRNHNCGPHGECIPNNHTSLGYSCRCEEGWVGQECRSHISCVSTEDRYLCKNGGTCVVHSKDPPSCNCGSRLLTGTYIYTRAQYRIPGVLPFRFTGATCEEVNDPCKRVVCQNGGSCMPLLNGYFCHCKPGFTGPLCESQIDECVAQNPCQQGSCIQKSGKISCRCIAGWTGQYCEAQLDLCQDSNPCQHDHKCRGELPSTRICDCGSKHRGVHCEEGITYCQLEPCLNNGTCVEKFADGYSCSCEGEFTGANCETKIDLCAGWICENNGTCVVQEHHPFCLCQPGFFGKRCQNDPCHNMTCQHGGTCVPAEDGAMCHCPPNYTGTHCETFLDPCHNMTCQHEREMVQGTLGPRRCSMSANLMPLIYRYIPVHSQ
ncbi:hypothetical protein GCK32_006777 [Trichostrongylus colubriformis]|uniref:Uncharacterized protein n=1 Tax=Trichostrongylus colubriformis TaxID=6319 RepID=A0AAN8FJM0_TRICO